MEFVRLALRSSNNGYSYKESSSIKMDIIGIFLATDVGCYWPSFKEWASDITQIETESNATRLEKISSDVFLSDIYSMEKKPTKLKMSSDQFIQLLDDWKEKVCEKKPREVIIKHENDQFIIDTKD